jgi:hypothetical protein
MNPEQPTMRDVAKQAEVDAIFDLLGVPTEGRRWLLIAEMS